MFLLPLKLESLTEPAPRRSPPYISDSAPIDVLHIPTSLHPRGLYTFVHLCMYTYVRMHLCIYLYWQLWGSLMYTILIDVMWVNKHPKLNLKEWRGRTHTLTLTVTYSHLPLCHWHTPTYKSLLVQRQQVDTWFFGDKRNSLFPLGSETISDHMLLNRSCLFRLNLFFCVISRNAFRDATKAELQKYSNKPSDMSRTEGTRISLNLKIRSVFKPYRYEAWSLLIGLRIFLRQVMQSRKALKKIQWIPS